MSFSDAMSSGRGPGMVGMLMALLVLLGFGAMSLLVFDKNLQGGGKSIESVVRENEDEIDSLKLQIEQAKEELQTIKKNVENTKKGQALSAEMATIRAEAEAVTDKMSKGIEEISKLDQQFQEYRNKYRAQVRNDAEGEKLAEIKTIGGTTYYDVELKEVSEIGIAIRHRDGSKRITYEELAPEWQEKFQFDPKEKAEALAREEAARAEYDKATVDLTANNDSEKPDSSITEIKNLNSEAGQKELNRRILQRENYLATLKIQWGRLQSDALKLKTGGKVLRRGEESGVAQVRSIRQRIQVKEREIARCRQEISALRAMQR